MAADNERQLTGRVVSAARALAGVGEVEFAGAAGIPVEVLHSLEAGGSAWIEPGELTDAVQRALTFFGVIVIDEADGMGGGVRLKFTRQDVRQIIRLEGEGGIIASDDAP